MINQSQKVCSWTVALSKSENIIVWISCFIHNLLESLSLHETTLLFEPMPAERVFKVLFCASLTFLQFLTIFFQIGQIRPILSNLIWKSPVCLNLTFWRTIEKAQPLSKGNVKNWTLRHYDHNLMLMSLILHQFCTNTNTFPCFSHFFQFKTTLSSKHDTQLLNS